MRVKFIIPKIKELEELEKDVNSFLDSLDDDPKRVVYDMEKCYAVIEYDNVRNGALCCECKFWDTGQSSDGVIGLCQRCGGGKRFSDKACAKYEDVRK